MADIAPEDVDYVVKNALWVAATATTAPSVATAREFTLLFEQQLEAHWQALRAFYGAGVDVGESGTSRGGEQTTLGETVRGGDVT